MLTICCTGCGGNKPATTEFFHKHVRGRFGLRAQCKVCKNDRALAYARSPEGEIVRELNAARYRESGRAAKVCRDWRTRNIEKAHQSAAKWRSKNKDNLRERAHAYRDANREKVREKQRRADRKLQANPSHVLKKRVKARVRSMVRGQRLGSSEKLLGYTADTLRSHIEKQFEKGMNWKLLMEGKIHIDHIIPVAAFDIKSINDPSFKACWALSNLRPLWAEDNQRKQAKVLTLL